MKILLYLSLILMLVVVQRDAFSKNRLPRIAAVHLEGIAQQGVVPLLNNSMALLPTDALDVLNGRNKNDMLKNFRSSLGSAALPNNPLIKWRLDKRIRDTFKRLEKEYLSENNVIVYERDDILHVGILSISNRTLRFIIIDLQGDKRETAIKNVFSPYLLHKYSNRDSIYPPDFIKPLEDSDELQHVYPVVIRDGLPSNRIAISANSIDEYREATLAFNHGGENHLGIVKDIRFDANGEGQLVVVTSEGIELLIGRGKRGEPVIAADAEEFPTGDKLRGLLFLNSE